MDRRLEGTSCLDRCRGNLTKKSENCKLQMANSHGCGVQAGTGHECHTWRGCVHLGSGGTAPVLLQPVIPPGTVGPKVASNPCFSREADIWLAVWGGEESQFLCWQQITFLTVCTLDKTHLQTAFRTAVYSHCWNQFLTL